MPIPKTLWMVPNGREANFMSEKRISCSRSAFPETIITTPVRDDVTRLMGDGEEARHKFIEDNALDVKNLNI